MSERQDGFAEPDSEFVIRSAAFDALRQLQERFGETVPRTALEEGFTYEGRRVPFVGPSGIFKPAVLQLPLSITTVPLVAGRTRPYDDELRSDGLLTYRYRGTDPGHRDNRGLREAMARRIPLVYLYGITPGRYMPVWPVYIVGDDAHEHAFTVEVDVPESVLKPIEDGASSVPEIRRRYVTSIVHVRVHQVAFRERVIAAYREQCAVCRLKHDELLDAAHILPDKHPRGDPRVANGLALCKLHHAAFDRHILGVRPDLVVEIRADILLEEDGPTLEHGLQGFQGKLISVPRAQHLRPDAECLSERYELFRQAS